MKIKKTASEILPRRNDLFINVSFKNIQLMVPQATRAFLPMLLSEVEEPDSSFFSRITLKVFASIEKYKEKKQN